MVPLFNSVFTTTTVAVVLVWQLQFQQTSSRHYSFPVWRTDSWHTRRNFSATFGLQTPSFFPQVAGQPTAA
jgi:hypothetical protein